MPDTPNRVYQYTSSVGTGAIVMDGQPVFPAFFTADEAVGLGYLTLDSQPCAIIEQGDDVELSRITITALSPFTFIREVLASRIDGAAGTAKLNIGGAATVQFGISGEDFDAKVTIDDVMAAAGPTAAAAAAGNITLDVDGGRVLFFKRTLAGNEQVQVPVDMPDGSTIYLRVTPGANTLSWATGFKGADGALPPTPTTDTLYAIVRDGTEYLVMVAGSNFGA